jgi:putative endonuclease
MDPKLPNQSTRQKGNCGEQIAVDYLLSKGYSVVCKQYRSRRGEIDCVAQDADGTLVFVEVKSSQGKAFGNPLSWVTPQKQKILTKMAQQYIKEHNLMGVPCRFDVIAVWGEKIDHLENAFFAV